MSRTVRPCKLQGSTGKQPKAEAIDPGAATVDKYGLVALALLLVLVALLSLVFLLGLHVAIHVVDDGDDCRQRKHDNDDYDDDGGPDEDSCGVDVAGQDHDDDDGDNDNESDNMMKTLSCCQWLCPYCVHFPHHTH